MFKVPPQRILFYLILLPLLPLFLYLPFHYVSLKKELQTLQCRVQKIKQESFLKEQRQSLNVAVRNTYASCNSQFLNEQVATLSLLSKEREAIKRILTTTTFPGNEAIESRYRFLEKGNNALSFQECSSQKKENILETLVSLQHPVEIDGSDLKTILQKIEGKEAQSPQLLFTDFKLNKKRMPNQGEAYELNMQILKREYLP